MSVCAFVYPKPLVKAHFIERYKRFFASVYLDDDPDKKVFPVHCANSGSMKSCIESQANAWILDSENPQRKLRYSLEALELEDGYACLNTQRANQVLQGLMQLRLRLSAISFPGADLFIKDFGNGSFRPEAKFNSSTRFDGLVTREDEAHVPGEKHWIEVKSVSLRASAKTIAFPDAVTLRGKKHLCDLAESVQRGDKATLIFAVMRGQNIEPLQLKEQFQIANQIDSKYHQAAIEAQKNGVQFRILLTSINQLAINARGYFPFEMIGDPLHPSSALSRADE